MSKTYVKEASLWLAAPIEQVFEFFSDAANLQVITPEWFNFRITTPQPIEMREGAIIEYKMKIRHVPIRWRTRIEIWEPPHRFADNQLKGPYKRWFHTHTFESKDGGTLCGDHIEYIVPGGPLAPIVHKLFVKRDVDMIFDYRQKKLMEEFGDAK